ncbi:polysaccharide deacetylase family protein [Actinoplanes subtropicus]|uniref:polysaccharide deacetylase family protein n=1 Tax=Actinoplanes subtropicus TaxID=543632 RepID=UPI0004C2F0A9|nr:polysaccharide deacetylase family protein [Actinoplanes subtropicus]
MRLSRSKKLVLFGIALLMVGLAGRAAADETSSARTQAKPAASAPSPAKQQQTRKPPAKATESAKQKIVTVSARQGSGPGGSRMVTGGKAVALTFDDGPDPAETPQILRLLAQQHVHATFCLVGKNVAKFPALVRQIVAGGNTVCNHTWSHDLKLGKKTPDQIRADMARTNAAILKAAPNAKVKFFRAPGGNFTPQIVAIAKQLGMGSLYWKVDPRDWDHPKGETHAQHRARVIAKVEHNTHAGAIVLSHDYAQPDTIAAYHTLVPWLKKRFQLIGM